MSLYLPAVAGNSKIFIFPTQNPKLAIIREFAKPDIQNSALTPSAIRLDFETYNYQNFTLMIQISNHLNSKAGILENPKIELFSRLAFRNWVTLGVNWVSLGGIFSFSLYNLISWFFRRKDTSQLLLFLLGFSICTWIMPEQLSSDMLFSSTELSYRLSLVGMSMSVFYFVFIRSLLRYKELAKLNSALIIYSSLSILVASFFDLTTLNKLIIFYQSLTVLSGLVTVSFLLHLTIKKNRIAKKILALSLVFTCSIALDSSEFIKRFHLPLSLSPLIQSLLFIFLSYQLAVRNRREFNRKRRLAEKTKQEQIAIRYENSIRLELASDLAHRINNPLNYIQTGVIALLQESQRLHARVFALFEGAENDQHALMVKKDIQENFDSLQQTVKLIEKGTDTATTSIKELRILSGVDGLHLELISLDSFLEKVFSDSFTLKEACEYKSDFVYVNTMVIREAVSQLRDLNSNPLELVISKFEDRFQISFHYDLPPGMPLPSKIKRINSILEPYQSSIVYDKTHTLLNLNLPKKAA